MNRLTPLALVYTCSSLRRLASLAVVAVSTLAVSAQSTVAAPEPGMHKPTIVLVHGAFADSSSWDGVVSVLLAEGYPVVAASIPMRGLKSDADGVAALLATIDGPIVLVGHSYGGAVITNSAKGTANIKALVYVAGLAPDVGETSADLVGRYPGSTLGPTLATPVALPDGGKDLYIRQDAFPEQFAADISFLQAKRMAATQRPINEAALNEASATPAWRSIPSWFIFGSLDKNIPAAAHSFMAVRAGARGLRRIEGASHVVMISHPDAVAQIIGEAAGVPAHALPPTHHSAAEMDFGPAPVVPLAAEPPARIILDSPLPDQLASGYVVVRYRALNARIMPVYGPSALGVSPRIAHLHITVDDLPWHLLDASGEPLSINGLAPGAHTLLVELEDPSHRVMDKATLNFEIPARPGSPR